MTRVTLRCNVMLTFSYPSHLKHLVLIVFLEDCLPEMLSKLGGLDERGMKVKKNIAPECQPSHFCCKKQMENVRSGTHPRILRIPQIPRIRWHDPLPGPPLPHALGARMTVVNANSLKSASCSVTTKTAVQMGTTRGASVFLPISVLSTSL